MFTHFYFERVRETVSGGRAERERGRESQIVLIAQRRMGLDLMNHEVKTGAEIKSRTLNPLSHPGAPCRYIFANIHR